MNHLNVFLLAVSLCFLPLSTRASDEGEFASFCGLMQEDMFCENKKKKVAPSTKQDSLLDHISSNTSAYLEFKNTSTINTENRDTGEELNPFSIREGNFIGEYRNDNAGYRASLHYKVVYRSRDTDTGEALTDISKMQHRVGLTLNKMWKTPVVNFAVGYQREYRGTEDYLKREMAIIPRDELHINVQKIFTKPLFILSLNSSQQYRIVEKKDSGFNRNRFDYKLQTRKTYLFGHPFIKHQLQYDFETKKINREDLSFGLEMVTSNSKLLVVVKREQDFRVARDIWEDAYKAEIIFKLFI
jgi:hypothetical protein